MCNYNGFGFIRENLDIISESDVIVFSSNYNVTYEGYTFPVHVLTILIKDVVNRLITLCQRFNLPNKIFEFVNSNI